MTWPAGLTDAQIAAHIAILDEPHLTQALNALQIEDDNARAWAASPQALHQTALYYATALGWPVFPLRPGLKTPATQNGFHDATTNPDKINLWWGRNPDLNIGLPTGTHFDVLDVDIRLKDGHIIKNGFLSLADWRDETPAVGQLINSALAVAYTAGDGRHYYIPPTGRGNGADLRPGIDWRGTGGYVCAPPSRLDEYNGRRYSWITPPKATQ